MASPNILGPVPYAVFENFVMRAGPKKISLVKKYKKSLAATEPKSARDYYAEFKGRLRSFHAGDLSDKDLKAYLKTLDESHREHVGPNLAGYLKLQKTHKISDIDTASFLSWDKEGVRVNIRPDMRGKLNDVETYFRFYMKKQALAPDRAQILLELMYEAIEFESGTASGKQAAVVDCRRSKIYIRNEISSLDQLQLSIEANYWRQIFSAV